MSLKHLVAYVERVCNPEGYLTMVNGLLHLALGAWSDRRRQECDGGHDRLDLSI